MWNPEERVPKRRPFFSVPVLPESPSGFPEHWDGRDMGPGTGAVPGLCSAYDQRFVGVEGTLTARVGPGREQAP